MTISRRDYDLLRKFSGAPAEPSAEDLHRVQQLHALGLVEVAETSARIADGHTRYCQIFLATPEGDSSIAEYEDRHRELLQMERQARAAERALIISIVSIVISACALIWSLVAPG